jgi:hypothetical protein
LLTALKTLAGLLPFFNALASWLEDWRKQKEAEQLAKAALNNAEVEAVNAMAEVVANSPTRDDVAQRLHDGSF